jgi:hypothetical protein
MKIWWLRLKTNEKLWDMTGQLNINMEIRKLIFGWIGHALRKDDSKLARQLCNGIHKLQEEGQEIHGDELHWMKVGSTAGVILGLSPGTEEDGEDL